MTAGTSRGRAPSVAQLHRGLDELRRDPRVREGALRIRADAEDPAVLATLTAGTRPAPKRRVRRSDARLDRTVPLAMIIVTMPAKPTGTSRLSCMTGHPAPRSESGRPRLMKAM